MDLQPDPPRKPPRLIAPAHKVIPFLDGLITKGREAAAMEIAAGQSTGAMQEWYLLAFESLRRAFDGAELRAELNRANARPWSERHAALLEVMEMAAELARRTSDGGSHEAPSGDAPQ